MSGIMETAASDAHPDHRRTKNKFKLTSFPDYVRKVQQLSFNQTPAVTANSEREGSSGIKKQNLSRAFSCFTTSSNSPNLPSKTSDIKQPRLPPLHGATRRRQEIRGLQFKHSTSQENTSDSNNSSPLRPTVPDHLKSQEVSIHRASSFPLINDTSSKATVVTTKPKRQMNKSPYLQPLVHKTYYHKESRSNDKGTKGQGRKKSKQQKLNTSIATAACKDKEEINLDNSQVEASTFLIPSITLRAATPSANGNDDMSTSLVDQFTARRQLANELDKLNKEMQDIVVSVEQVE